ncbi:HAD-IA family hydrolase [Pseudonocardia alni]|uniref:HAD family hydrolase n=1 Tax=Pseudonocardia alni TaxID=33907 RepID=UPI0027A1749B|nr:HAD family hydrolase [Pseudonocardia alni]
MPPLPPLLDLVDLWRPAVVSSDLFDTVLLRDHSGEAGRLAAAARRGAHRIGADPRTVTRLRWAFHRTAYLGVAMTRPEGDTRLDTICTAVADALGRDAAAARALADTEVEVDAEHLRPNRALLGLLQRAAERAGAPLVAVSDMYYSADQLRTLLQTVLGTQPFARIHVSSEIGLTKHHGGLYDEVARREGVAPETILHVGDNHAVDVRNARAASWAAVHVPRGRAHGLVRLAGRIVSAPSALRRSA